MFKWVNSLITEEDRENLESIIVEFNDIFARYRHDIGMNTHIKFCLTPKHKKPVYTQSLHVPINLKDDLSVELASMHKYGIITTLLFSKYASPIFAQRKPNGKLRLVVELRRINALISKEYININHPISTLSDAAQHLEGKKLFCKLDCSQAYHCLQMADQRSVELNYLQINLLVGRLPTECWPKVLVGPCQHFQPLCGSISTESSKETSVPNMWMTLGLPPIQRNNL